MPRKPPLIALTHPISKELFQRIEAAVREAGYSAAIEHSERAAAPTSGKQLAAEAIYVICNSGMSNQTALTIFDRCMAALEAGYSAKTVYRHPGKAAAIDTIWERRRALFRQFRSTNDIIDFCAKLPWLGPITKFHLAKNLGVAVAQPDVHLNRLASAEGDNAQVLCKRLASETGYRAATIDLILWRACADGIIHSR
jgi:hypothetical protein